MSARNLALSISWVVMSSSVITAQDLCGGVADGGREKAGPAVAMLVVIPAEEHLSERAPIFDRSEAPR